MSGGARARGGRPVIPSPLATGGSGHNYEDHVGAAYLALLLVGGMTPFWPEAVLREVHFQTRHRGWTTDDFLLVGDGRTVEYRVAVQAKRTFALQASDKECVSTLRAAWDDFTNTASFNPASDRIVLVTGQAPTNFHRGMRSLLDAAHAALDAADFTRRLALNGHLPREARDCHQIITGILRGHAPDNTSPERIWSFLRVWDFAVHDLQAASSATEALVKSLLSATVIGPPIQANASWNALLALASSEPGRARSYTFAELPTDLRELHRTPPTAERDALENVQVVSRVVRAGVDDRVARTSVLPRPEMVAEGAALITEVDALIVAGPAGSGKSVIAAKLFDLADQRTLAMAFRADTLATPHLATSAANVGLALRSIVRLFALHKQKLLWIESGERLFEKHAPEREAFLDLLRLVPADQGWKLLITCRDHAADRFRGTFLEPNGFGSAVLSVPPLSDMELELASDNLPALRKPLGDPATRELLRNPFFLNVAARMNWTDGASVAATRRAFREKAWREIICREEEAGNGMPLERDRTMVEVALRRARSLVPYVHVDGMSGAALHALTRDSLLVPDPDDPAQYAPAHDMFEDWALLQWLRRLHDRFAATTTAFFAELGTHPALRRAYRIWLLERIDAAPTEVENSVLSIMGNLELEAHWRNETLVAVLQSSGAERVLLRLEPRLKSEPPLLRTTAHLLRVACRVVPPQTSNPAHVQSPLLPEGVAWKAVAAVIVRSISALTSLDIFWLLSFAEDFAAGARGQQQRPGASDVHLLAEGLMSWTQHVPEDYRKDYRDRVLRVMLSIPLESETTLRKLIHDELEQPRRRWATGSLLPLAWDHFSGADLCRELPDVVVHLVETRLRLANPTAMDQDRHHGLLEVGQAFGLGHLSNFDHAPESAWQGPFLNLLTHAPDFGTDLALRFVNSCCSTYVSNLAVGLREPFEPPVEIELILEDGTAHPQHASARLWCLYRATGGAGPTTLQSALMALEAWLFMKAERGDDDLAAVFTRLLVGSNNVAITAVLTSVATAFPYLLREAALPLLTCPDFFWMDQQRWVHDQSHHTVNLAEHAPERDPEKRRLVEERIASAKRPHRKHHIEALAGDLQLTSARNRVWQILDEYAAELPSKDLQNDDDRLWRLRLHRMDLRTFVHTGETDDGRAMFEPGPPAPDLAAFRERDLPGHKEQERRMSAYLWGTAVFDGSEPEKYRPEDWREMLALARGFQDDGASELTQLLDRSGEPQIAATCVRDHWNEMSESERTWCANSVCTAIEDANGRGSGFASLAAMSGSPGVRAAVDAVSLVAARVSDSALRDRAKRCLADALLQRERTVSQCAANGIGAHLFGTDRNLALAGIQTLVSWAQQKATFQEWAERLPPNARTREDHFEIELRERLGASFATAKFTDESVLFAIDYLREPGFEIFERMLGILRKGYVDPLAQQFHVHVAEVLVAAWKADEAANQGGRRYGDDTVVMRYESRRVVRVMLARFALACPENVARAIVAPLCAATKDYVADAGEFVEDLAYAADTGTGSSNYWVLWRLFVDVLLREKLDEKTNAEAKHSRVLMRALFLGIDWKPHTRSWPTLTGNAQHILDLFERAAFSLDLLRWFIALAARFRGEFVPRALPFVARKLQSTRVRFLGDAEMSSLESILEPLISAGTTDIRRSPELRAATLYLLDTLVELGSSAAFRLRDDFLTPLRS